MKLFILISVLLPGFSAIAQETTREEWEAQQHDRQELLFKDDYEEQIKFQRYEHKVAQPTMDSALDARIDKMVNEHYWQKWEQDASPMDRKLERLWDSDPNGWRFDEDEWRELYFGRSVAPKYYRHPVHGSNGGVEIG